MLRLKNKSRISKKKLVSLSLLIASLCLLAYGLSGFYGRHQATNNPNPTISSEVVAVSSDEPDETPITEACESYTAPPSQPRKIVIESIDVDGCIERVGVDQNNAVAVPTNIHLAGWYIDSPSPGEEGVSLIDGHVLGRFNDAIFANLHKLEANDVIKIQRGDGTWQEFKVLETSQYYVNQASANLFKKVEGVDRQLNLITCYGTYDEQTKTYDQRVIVKASLL